MAKRAKFSASQVDQAHKLLEVSTREHPLTSEELGNKLGLEDIEGNWYARSLILEVIRQKGLPVAALGNGYYTMKTLGDLKDYREDLNRRILQISERILLAEKTFRDAYGEGGKESDSRLDEGF